MSTNSTAVGSVQPSPIHQMLLSILHMSNTGEVRDLVGPIGPSRKVIFIACAPLIVRIRRSQDSSVGVLPVRQGGPDEDLRHPGEEVDCLLTR